MSDLELLFLVLGVVYGWECACWAPRGSVAFVTWLGKRWRAEEPPAQFGNRRGGFIFAPPLPPLGTFLTGHRFPISLSPEAALAYATPIMSAGGQPEQTGKLLAWEEIRSIEAKGKGVVVNGELWLKAASRGFGEYVVEKLRQVSQAAPTKRESAINEILRETLDTKAIQKRWEEFQKQTANIRPLTNSLFGYLFILAPAVIWHFGLQMCWLGLLAGLLLLTTTTAILFRRAHKTLYPLAEDERFTHFLTILLSPATTVRAHDVISRPLLEKFHPLALAKVFCSEPDFREFGRRVLRELRHPALPVCPRPEAAAQAAERYWRTSLQKRLEEFLRKSGVDAEELLRPPAPADETCRSFCPRCLAQFTSTGGSCADCGGLALVAFPRKFQAKSPAREQPKAAR
jgi:hypothetical protein